MPTIKIDVHNKLARCADKRAFAVCGNNDYTISFNFDAEWDDYPVKTARFAYNGKYQDVAFTGTECAMPALYGVNSVFIGVYAGDIRTTAPAQLLMVRSIMDGKPKHDEPTADVYNQILALMEAGKIKGDKGDQGDQGEQGIQGIQGIQGEQGEKGDKGDKGDQGIQGIQGIQGEPGKDGTNGKDGADGFSPTATVTQTSTGADVSITDKNGTTNATITNGSDANVTAENIKSALGYTPLESAPVTSVNGKVGAVEIAASDVGAISDTDGSVSNAHLASGAVTTDKLAEAERMTSANIVGVLGYTPADSDENYELINSITTTEETEYFVWNQDLNGKSFDLKHGLIKTTSPESLTSALKGSIYWRGSGNGSSNIVFLSVYDVFFSGSTADVYYWIHNYGQRVEALYELMNVGNANASTFKTAARYIQNPHINELRFYFSPKIPAGATIELYGIRA